MCRLNVKVKHRRVKQILELAADLVPLETGLETITASGDDLEKKISSKHEKKILIWYLRKKIRKKLFDLIVILREIIR